MQLSHLRPTRRQFITTLTCGGVSAVTCVQGTAHHASLTADRFSFIVAGDTHYLADKEKPEAMDATSKEICGRLVDTFNRLPGLEIPAEAGGGAVLPPLGLIHVGDIIDTGDKNGGVTSKMQVTEWSAFADDFGLTGSDGRLKYPVYEVFGNHDAPHGTGLVLDKIVERNKRRPGVSSLSANGLHYSWDWSNIHFINLGLIVGSDRNVHRKRRYAALDSLDFLISDLDEKVGDSRRPVIITHHVDVARYTRACDLTIPADSQEWDPCDVQAFYQAIKNHRVLGIFYGHTHVRNVLQWDGQSSNAKSGVAMFNSDNASHFSGDAQAFFYVEVSAQEMVVREYQTRDGWRSGTFTPRKWVSQFSPA
jgi:cytolysin (calcineurin-like family phosphatase)